MHNRLLQLDLTTITPAMQQQATQELESGKVAFFPQHYFQATSTGTDIFSPAILDGKHKNISYHYPSGKLGGINRQHNNTNLTSILQTMMQNYAIFAKNLIDSAFPSYSSALKWGRTSYRPAEIDGRVSSKRRDDTRLHVDAFAATPVYGQRILRVFCNINPEGQPRVWHLGEPFSTVFSRFAAIIPTYSYSIALMLRLIKATKTLRSAYDHYQLHLHDTMKLDDYYQDTVNKDKIDFPAMSTWLVFTDHVSHAALSGQFLLEQTFYLPISAMSNPQHAPLHYWQKEKANKELC